MEERRHLTWTLAAILMPYPEGVAPHPRVVVRN